MICMSNHSAALKVCWISYFKQVNMKVLRELDGSDNFYDKLYMKVFEFFSYLSLVFGQKIMSKFNAEIIINSLTT